MTRLFVLMARFVSVPVLLSEGRTVWLADVTLLGLASPFGSAEGVDRVIPFTVASSLQSVGTVDW